MGRFRPISDVLFAGRIISRYTDVKMGISTAAERLLLQSEETQQQQSTAVNNQIINYYQNYNQTMQTLITLNSCSQQNLLLQPCFRFISQFLLKNTKNLLNANSQTTIHNQQAFSSQNIKPENRTNTSYFLNSAKTILLENNKNTVEHSDIISQETVLQSTQKELIKTVQKQLNTIEKEKSIKQAYIINQKNEAFKLQQTVKAMHIDHIQQLLTNTILQGEVLIKPYAKKQTTSIAKQLKIQDYQKTAAALQSFYLSQNQSTANLNKNVLFNSQLNNTFLEQTQHEQTNQTQNNTLSNQQIQQNTLLNNTLKNISNQTVNQNTIRQNNSNNTLSYQQIQQNILLNNTFPNINNQNTVNQNTVSQNNGNNTLSNQQIQQNTLLNNTYKDINNQTVNQNALYQSNNNTQSNQNIQQNILLNNTYLHNASVLSQNSDNRIINKQINLTSYKAMTNRFQTLRQTVQSVQQKQELLNPQNSYFNEENNRYTTNTSYIKHDSRPSAQVMTSMLHKKENDFLDLTKKKLTDMNIPQQGYEEMPLLHRKQSNQAAEQTDFDTNDTQKNPDIEFITKTVSSNINEKTTVTKNTAINEPTNVINGKVHTVITGDSLADLLETDLALPDSKLQSVFREKLMPYQNVEKITAQVYKAIENKLKTERTRRGL